MRRHALAPLVLTTAFLSFPTAYAAEGTSSAAQCSAPGEQSSVTHYIIASAAAVRAAPSASAELMGYAPIATQLEVACQQDGWLKVRADGMAYLAGWVRADLAGPEQPTRAATLDALRGVPVGNAAALRTQAERVLAFDPLDETNVETVLQVVRSVGDADLTQKLERRLAGLHAPTVARAQNEDKMLFAVSDNSLTPIATFADGKWSGYSWSDGDEETRKAGVRFATRYLASGHAYHFYTRGGLDGAVLAAGRQEVGCSSMSAKYKRAGGKPDTAGVAANFPLTERLADPDTALSDAQKRTALEVAGAQLKSYGVPAASMARLLRAPKEGEAGLAMSAIPSAGQTGLVISSLNFSEDAKGGYSFLFVMEPDKSGKYAITHRFFKKMKSDEDYNAYRLLAYADVDGDGEPELVLLYNGYELWRYEIFKRDGKGWKKLVEGGDGGC